MVGKNHRSTMQTGAISKQILILLGVLLVAGVLFFVRSQQSLFFAARVNGQPIWRNELSKRLNDRFGQQLMEAMIGERLILEAAAKDGVTVTDQDVAAKVKEIEGTLTGAMNLDDTLKLQGITRSEFEKQVRVQLAIDKMFSDEVSVSAEEVAAYVETNKAMMSSSDPAQQTAQAQTELKSNKINEKFVEWFSKAKEAAQIQRFL